MKIQCSLWSSCATQVHGLLRRIGRDAVEHDAGQHGAQQQGEAAGDSLDAGEGAARWPTDDREPEVSVAEVLGCLHEKQITDRERNLGYLFFLIIAKLWHCSVMGALRGGGLYGLALHRLATLHWCVIGLE